jgi:histidyl-tRNA synthetase
LDLLIGENPVTSARRDEILAGDAAVQVYVVVAAEDRREQALGCVQSLRDAGWRVDFSPGGGKVGKQFQSASASGARFAVVVGGEWPEVSVKALDTRAEDRVAHGALAAWLNSHYTP